MDDTAGVLLHGATYDVNEWTQPTMQRYQRRERRYILVALPTAKFFPRREKAGLRRSSTEKSPLIARTVERLEIS